MLTIISVNCINQIWREIAPGKWVMQKSILVKRIIMNCFLKGSPCRTAYTFKILPSVWEEKNRGEEKFNSL